MSTPPQTHHHQFNVGSGSMEQTGTLTYATLLPSKGNTLTRGYHTPKACQFEEVPASEPDLQKKPLRSAMKGGKKQEMLHMQLAQQLRQKQLEMNRTSSGSDTPTNRGPPVAPKPKVRLSGG